MSFCFSKSLFGSALASFLLISSTVFSAGGVLESSSSRSRVLRRSCVSVAAGTAVALSMVAAGSDAAPVAANQALKDRAWLEGRNPGSFSWGRDSRFCAEFTQDKDEQGRTVSRCTLTNQEAHNLLDGREKTDNGRSCFSPSTKVYNDSGEPLKMKDLKLGDFILDGSDEPTEVVGWLHLQAGDQNTQMVDFYDFDGELIVSVSSKHLLYDVDGRTHFAKDFEVGQGFQMKQREVIQVGEKRIRQIKDQEINTLMAPLTASGSLLVGEHRIKASCFAELNAPKLAYWYTRIKRVLIPYRGEVDLVDHQVLDLLI